jgi:hypothetical protein
MAEVEAVRPSAEAADLSSEGMFGPIPPRPSSGPLLQSPVSPGRTAMVAVEGAAEVPGQQEGKATRKAEHRRRREQIQTRPAQPVVEKMPARVITRRFFEDSCDRPGCYETFARTRRSPLQRFCSRQCRRALERVLERERRWAERGAERHLELGLTIGPGRQPKSPRAARPSEIVPTYCVPPTYSR